MVQGDFEKCFPSSCKIKKLQMNNVVRRFELKINVFSWYVVKFQVNSL